MPVGRQRTIVHRLGLFLVSGLVAMTAPLTAQSTRFERLSVEDGLSHSTVWDVHHGSRGFIWFATQDGLNRYDGHEIVAYRSDVDDPTSLSDNDILDIDEDSLGRLWLRTRSGLERFDRTLETFRSFDLRSDVGGPSLTTFLEDSRGNIWLATHQGLARYSATDDAFDILSRDPQDPETLGNRQVRSITEDSQGSLWLATPRGLDRLDPETGTFEHFGHQADDPNSLTSNDVWHVYEDRLANLWVATTNGLSRLDPTRKRVDHCRYVSGVRRDLRQETIFSILETSSGALWIATESGIARWNEEQEAFEPFGSFRDPKRAVPLEGFMSLLEDRDGNLWISTQNHGVLRLDRGSESLRRFDHDPADPHSLIDHQVLGLAEDSTGVLWIGTYQGVSKYDPRRERFATYNSHLQGGGLSGPGIWGLYEDGDGVLWVGTYNVGLNRLDPGSTPGARRPAVHYLPDPEDPTSLSSPVVTAIVEDSTGALWVGTYNGLSRMDRQREGFEQHYRHDLENPQSLAHDQVFSLLEDRSGNLWVGTDAGLDRLSPDRQGFVHFQHDLENPESLVAGSIYRLLEDSSGAIWAGSVEHGLSRFDARESSFHNYLHDPDDAGSLSANGIGALYEDSNGILWVGTYNGGLDRLDRETDSFRHYNEKHGLPNASVLGILGDENGHLWLATYQGLSRFDPVTESFRNFDADDGLQSNVYSSGSTFSSPTGELFFGGVNGLDAFFPDNVGDDPVPPVVRFTHFRLAGEALRPGRTANSPLQTSITEARELVLNHRHRTFSIEFAALHFASPRKNRYAYRLQGFDDDWIHTDADQRRAHYTNLDPGTYTLQVKASNQDGVWTEESAAIELTVLPPPWLTWWAYTLYGALFVAAISGIVQWQQRRLERERALSARLREVDRLKDEFLASTSHELRTPLYGITGLAESLLDNSGKNLPETVQSKLAMIVASGRRLAHLVNDILDFSKLSRKSLELHRRPVDLETLTQVVLTMSRPLIGIKDLQLVNSIDSRLPPAYADENRLQQILYNLVGNAIKFTETGVIEVSAVAEGGRLVIGISDTGIGIPEDKLERIFESFEQVDASAQRQHGGTGLGLAVTRQLVTLHGGTIWAESRLNEGSRFYFTLPLATADDDDHIADLAMDDEPAEIIVPLEPDPLPETEVARVDAFPDAPHLLIVDDEPVIRQVLRGYLETEGYRLTLVPNGVEALQMLELETIDLILLDVMMPRMSGIEVCRILRKKWASKDLPVIFLTAKNSPLDLVAGFDAGANDYLTKPVAKRELLARIKTHLELLKVHRHLENVVDEKMAEIKVLSGLLPICSSCKKIRDDHGQWQDLESFIDEHSEAQFSHGICPTCTHVYYGRMDREAHDVD